MLPNSVHLTLTPSIIFQGYKLDINTQAPIPFGTFASLHYAKLVINIILYEPHTENVILYLAFNVISNVVAWIPGRNRVVTINKHTQLSRDRHVILDFRTTIAVSSLTCLIF